MRPLNRPMFRYGGPIKEGIMSGIKEPRQNYNRAGKVLKYFPGRQKLVNKIPKDFSHEVFETTTLFGCWS